MTLVKCDKYPELQIHDLNIVFKKGVAEVVDKKKVDALKKMVDKYGFTFETVAKEPAGGKENKEG